MRLFSSCFVRSCSLFILLSHFGCLEKMEASASMLSIGAALNRARDTAPELQASHGDLQASLALYEQAGKLKNPDFNLFVEDIDGSRCYGGWKLAQVTYTLTQEFDIWKKRASRASLAQREALISHYQSVIAWQAVRKELVDRFLQARFLEEKLRIAEERALLAEEGLAQVKLHVAEGRLQAALVPVEELRCLRMRLEVESAERILEHARHLLALRMGDPCFEYECLDYPLEELIDPVDCFVEWPQLEKHPLLARARQVVEASRQRVVVEQRALLPNPQVLVGFRQRPGLHTYSFVAGLGFPLMLWDRNEAAVSAARWQLASDEAKLLAAERQLREELNSRQHAVSHAYFEATRYCNLLAQAEKSYLVSQLAFREGVLPLTDWIQVQHEWFSMRFEVAEFFLKYHQEKEALSHLIETLIMEISSS